MQATPPSIRRVLWLCVPIPLEIYTQWWIRWRMKSWTWLLYSFSMKEHKLQYVPKDYYPFLHLQREKRTSIKLLRWLSKWGLTYLIVAPPWGFQEVFKQTTDHRVINCFFNNSIVLKIKHAFGTVSVWVITKMRCTHNNREIGGKWIPKSNFLPHAYTNTTHNDGKTGRMENW